MTKLKVSSENSKIINGELYITAVLAQNLKKAQKASVDYSKKVTFPKLGVLVLYNNEFIRS
jgi:hypothetical protein